MHHLFSPFRIKNLELHNRIVMPGLASFLIESDGTITDRTVEHYRLRAAGGPAMVIMEACAVAPEGIVSAHQARIYDDGFVSGLAKIARAMKQEGAVPAVQIHHGGRQTSYKVIKRTPVAPSPLPCPAIRGDVHPLSREEIRELVAGFGTAARRAVDAGFELLEIHGAHGYLINQFLSPFSNIRRDRYGGDTEGRTRFATEVIREVRAQVGPDFPLSFKISAQEFVEGGLTVKESIKILRILVEAGIDLVQVSAGNDATPEWISQPMFMEQACLADSAAAIRNAVRIPVMAVGRINDPVVADEIISTGKADLVCIGRGLMADPEMPTKARQGRLDEIRMCIACNTCMESIFRKGRVECLVNPALGREKEMAIRPATVRRKVAVIGGGPGGLNVAWVAARRGHEVHMFEKGSELGGQLILGSATGYKTELKNLIRFQKTQIEKYGVICHLKTTVDPEALRHLNPDVVILATGSRLSMPQIAGIDKALVVPVSKMLNGVPPGRKKTVIIGGGATGCEVALHLAEHGCDTTIVEMLPEIGTGLESMTRRILFKKLAGYGVKMMNGSTAVEIRDEGVVITGDGGRRDEVIPAERVVFATGNVPDDALFRELTALGYEVHQIGDCLQPRNAKAAIFEGAVLGRSL